jgi:hypothetical protein
MRETPHALPGAGARNDLKAERSRLSRTRDIPIRPFVDEMCQQGRFAKYRTSILSRMHHGFAPVLCAGRQVRPDPAQRYAHAKQLKRANRALKTLRTYLGRVIRDVGRKIEGNGGLEAAFAKLLALARRVREQQQRQRGPKVYSLHAPEVECIGKGKAYRPYEFGVKVSVPTTISHAKGGQFVTHVKALLGNPYDGHTLKIVIPDMEAMVGNTLARILADKGYRGHNAPPDHKLRVFISGQKRGVTTKIKRELRRRSAVEHVIGHLKTEHRMGRNYLWFSQGDAATPSWPPPATTSAASSAGSRFCCVCS